MSDDDLTFASFGVAGIHYAKCWSCMTQQCPGGWHAWADANDIAHAERTGQPDPSKSKCGCPCADGPSLEPEEDWPDMDAELDAPACTVCGETGACGYDAEGRPLIHATDPAEDE